MFLTTPARAVYHPSGLVFSCFLCSNVLYSCLQYNIGSQEGEIKGI
jgi:hypothetical protein